MKVDRRLEVFDVPEPPSGLLHPLDRGVDGLQAGIGEPVPEVGQDIREVALDQLGHLGYRLQPAVGGAPEPAGEERLRGSAVRVLPELAEPLLEGPGPGDLELAPVEALEGRPLRVGHVVRPHEPEVLRPREPVILGLFQGSVLGLSHLVHRVMEVLRDVELVEDDLRRSIVQMGPRRLDVGLPHVHGDRLDPFPLGGREGLPEPVQALLRAVLREIQNPAPLRIRDHREVPMPLGDRLLVHPEARDDVVAAAGEAPGHRAGLDPHASSQVIRRRSAPPWTAHSWSRSMAKRSNRAVN